MVEPLRSGYPPYLSSSKPILLSFGNGLHRKDKIKINKNFQPNLKDLEKSLKSFLNRTNKIKSHTTLNLNV